MDDPRPIRVAMIAFAGNHHTSRWCQALRQHGLDVHLVAPNDTNVGDPDPGTPLHPVTVPARRLPVFEAAAAWRGALELVQPDIVYMQWLFGRPGMLVALDAKWPLVVTVMGSDVKQDPALPESMLDRIWRAAVLLRAARITVVAPPLARVVAGYGPQLDGRIEVVPFGVDTDAFTPADPQPSAGPGTAVVLGHFKGDLTTYGRIELLQAVEPLIRVGYGIQLRLAGARGGDGGAVARFLASHPHVAAAVTDYGLQPIERMPELYRGLDLYVLNSRQESFGVAAAEALACGVPVIASDVGGVGTLVRSGETGLLCPPEDVAALREAIIDMAEHPVLRRSCAIRGREHVLRNFQWQTSVERMASVLKSCAKPRT